MTLFKRLLVLLFAPLPAVFVLPAYGQHAIGLNLDLNTDKVVIDDPGGQVLRTPRLNAAAGAFYQYTFKKGLHLDLGLTLKHFKESIGLGISNFSGTGQLVAQLPLTLGQNIFLLKNKIYISPLLGSAFNAMLLYNQDQRSSGQIGTKTDSLVFTSRHVGARQYYFTLHAGLQMGFCVRRSVSVFLFSRHTFGFSPISRQYITYRRNLEPPQSAVQTLNGSYLTFFGMGLSYALNRRPGVKD